MFTCLPSIGLVGNPPIVLISDLKDLMDVSVLVFFNVSLEKNIILIYNITIQDLYNCITETQCRNHQLYLAVENEMIH